MNMNDIMEKDNNYHKFVTPQILPCICIMVGFMALDIYITLSAHLVASGSNHLTYRAYLLYDVTNKM